MSYFENIIAGGGLAGVGAAEALQSVSSNLLIEKKSRLLGHVQSHEKSGVFFDEGVHVCHSKNVDWLGRLNLQNVNRVQSSVVKNYNNGTWIDYPVQNNLRQLPKKLADAAMEQVEKAYVTEAVSVKNYDDWLLSVYGEILTEKFYRKFTRKYWRTATTELGLDWLAGRLIPVDIDLVRNGYVAESESQAVFNSYLYPKKGGFEALFADLVTNTKKNADVKLDTNITSIDTDNREVATKDGKTFQYGRLFTSLPLVELPNLDPRLPTKIKNEISKLRHTRLFTVCVRVSNVDPTALPDWFYVYDEDLDVSRIFNVSKANGSDTECFLACETYRRSDENFISSAVFSSVFRSVQQIFDKSKIEIVTEFMTEYAYIVPLDINKSIIESARSYYSARDIHLIGIYGQWHYQWSDQAYLDAYNIAVSASV